MNLADGVDLEELIMSKDELSGADIKVISYATFMKRFILLWGSDPSNKVV